MLKNMTERNFISVPGKCARRKDLAAGPVLLFNYDGSGVDTEGECHRCGQDCGPIRVTGLIQLTPKQDPNIYGKVVYEPILFHST